MKNVTKAFISTMNYQLDRDEPINSYDAIALLKSLDPETKWVIINNRVCYKDEENLFHDAYVNL